ncbi:MAG: hypothetical protein M3O46_05000, partial [Myxococcota bacterium]|nr:hypothetical protein [Myxococcota bacterium]
LDQPGPEPAGPVPGWPVTTPQPTRASVVPDPFANAQPTPAPALAATPFSVAPPPPGKSPPWIPLAMIAAAIAFGITGAVVLFRPATPAAGPVTIPTPGALTAATATSKSVSAPAPSDLPEPGTTPIVTVVKGSAANAAKTATSATSANQGRSLDLHSLTQNSPGISPVDDQGGEGPKAASQCISEGQVQQVIGLHQTGIRRACWERNPTMKPTVNVGVALTIGADGSAQSVSTTGDEPSVTKCIENDIRNWRFPAMGCVQKTSFSFKFVRQ